jgi:hypothetical protein
LSMAIVSSRLIADMQHAGELVSAAGVYGWHVHVPQLCSLSSNRGYVCAMHSMRSLRALSLPGTAAGGLGGESTSSRLPSEVRRESGRPSGCGVLTAMSVAAGCGAAALETLCAASVRAAARHSSTADRRVDAAISADLCSLHGSHETTVTHFNLNSVYSPSPSLNCLGSTVAD